MERIEYLVAQAPLDALRDRHWDAPKFLAFCKECRNYNARWSCPPFSLDPDRLLDRYTHACLLGAKIILDEEAAASLCGRDAMTAYTDRVLLLAKPKADGRALGLEQRIPGSLALGSGGCRLCACCARVEQKPCIHQDRMRMSPESLGFDVSGLAQDCLNTPILWASDRLPPYYLLVNAVLLPRPLEAEELEPLQRPGEALV